MHGVQIILLGKGVAAVQWDSPANAIHRNFQGGLVEPEAPHKGCFGLGCATFDGAAFQFFGAYLVAIHAQQLNAILFKFFFQLDFSRFSERGVVREQKHGFYIALFQIPNDGFNLGVIWRLRTENVVDRFFVVIGQHGGQTTDGRCDHRGQRGGLKQGHGFDRNPGVDGA